MYIVTNPNCTVLYTGVTNDITQRLVEHYLKRGDPSCFAGRYSCFNLIYLEEYKYIRNAILREKEIKTWTRKKKEALIGTMNPKWKFLNADFFDKWPPDRKDCTERM